MRERRRAVAVGFLAALVAGGWSASVAAQAPPPTTLGLPGAPAGKQGPRAPASTKRGAEIPPALASAAASAHEPDLAFGAYQRGYYLTALSIATRRVQDNDDAKAMTLLGELYGNGLGVARDDRKAAEWYRRAADRGDREAMFALAMFRLAGRGGPANTEEATRLLGAAAKLGNVSAAYDLGLLCLEGQLVPQDFARAAELFGGAARAGSPEAQYALAALYREGKGVPKDLPEALRLLASAATADNTDAELEYGIALFNGTGVGKNEAAAAGLLRKAARKGNPVAQNRLANILAFGRGLPADPVQAIKWHLIARAGGDADPGLDDFMRNQKPEVRAAGENAAQSWIEAINQSHS
jgi:TPR repeat protein